MEENDGSMFLVMELVSEYLNQPYNDLLEELRRYRSEFHELCEERRSDVNKLVDQRRRFEEEGVIPSVDLNKALDSLSHQIQEDYNRIDASITSKILEMKEIYLLQYRILMTRRIALMKSMRTSIKDELIGKKAVYYAYMWYAFVYVCVLVALYFK
ncbi:hypothetical protein AQUCO_00400771v1 [Aquilegia coerulea]|uniref:Uncharacterized protein n=1 Tax=Aquilegia coerulea TaxID=218851 RepID=A0A2G5EWG5_AQUCA|nr:hypothetical protein AQUCO_00400771v1 [Aquilegia coerulea]